jgi:hypothetical protein
VSLTFQQAAWTAGIISASVAVIVNRTELKRFLKKRWKVLAVPFLVVGGYVCFLYGWLDWTRDLLNWFLHPVETPLWLLIVGVLVITVLFGTLLLLMWRNLPKGSGESVPLRHSDPSSYTHDEIFGVSWTWSYNGHYINDWDLSAFCPIQTCKCRLEWKDDYDRMNLELHGIPINLECPRCGFNRPFNFGKQELIKQVAVEVERRIRMGEFMHPLAG